MLSLSTSYCHAFSFSWRGVVRVVFPREFIELFAILLIRMVSELGISVRVVLPKPVRKRRNVMLARL